MSKKGKGHYTKVSASKSNKKKKSSTQTHSIYKGVRRHPQYPESKVVGRWIYLGGMYEVKAKSWQEAREIAENDPYIQEHDLLIGAVETTDYGEDGYNTYSIVIKNKTVLHPSDYD